MKEDNMEVYRMRRLAVFGSPLALIAIACFLLGDWRFNGLDMCGVAAMVVFVLFVFVDDAMVEKGRWKS